MLLLRSILFLDPHVKHLQKLGATGTKPGVRLNFAKKNIRSSWPDQFEAYELEGCCLSQGNFEGTLIRAPLRQPHSESEIKQDSIDDAAIQRIVDLMSREGHLWILFLKNVATIEVVDVETQQVLCWHQRHPHGRTHAVEIRSKLHSASVSQGLEERKTYQLSNVAEVSVALPLSHEEQGRVFSRLPLDIKSGLAAHVSALFWTSADRRSIVLDLQKDLEGWAMQNHQHLSSIARCLVASIAKLAASEKKVLLQFFPQGEKPSAVAEVLYDLFYTEVLQRCKAAGQEEPILYSVSGSCVSAASGRILLVKSDQWPSALANLRAPLVRVNDDVFHGLADKVLLQRTVVVMRSFWLSAWKTSLRLKIWQDVHWS